MKKRLYRKVEPGERCVDCGAPATEMDHRDYNRPVDVDPVCQSCNRVRGPGIPVFPKDGRPRDWELKWVRKKFSLLRSRQRRMKEILRAARSRRPWLSQVQIAKKFKVSPQRVNQILADAGLRQSDRYR